MIVPCLVALAAALASAPAALASPVLEPSSASVEFGPIEVHGPGFPSRKLHFSNGSLSSSTIVNSVAISGPDASEFSLPQDQCSGNTVPPFGSCEVEVRFQPGSPGEKSAMLELEESFGTVEVPLSGSGVTGTLSANPTPLRFRTTVDGNNQTEEVRINSENAGTHIDAVEVTGPDAESFSVAYGGCQGDTLQQNNWCNVGVRFEPSSVGEKTAQLVITSDGSGSPLIIPLAGTGANGPRLSLSARQMLLGEVLIGASAAQTFTLSNTGDYPLGIQEAFLVSGTPLMFPIVSDSCSRHEVEPGASCAITVDFAPTTPGPKAASIVLVTESVGVSAIGLEGTGVLGASPAAPAVGPRPPLAPGSSSSVALPRLLLLSAHPVGVSVSTGIAALCPASVTLCRIHSSLTTRLVPRRSHPSQQAARKTAVLLGSSLSALHGGQNAVVHVRLSPRGLALLKSRQRLKVSITVAITTSGAPTVMRTRTMILTAKSLLR